MRHSDGSLHAALIEQIDGTPRMSLFGARRAGEQMRRLGGPLGSRHSQGEDSPATDSNQNGVYVAYTEAVAGSRRGYLVHIPDPFGDPNTFSTYGPLTPLNRNASNSFLQASRGYNSVIYGWRDDQTGDIYVGVSKDGRNFPVAKPLVNDRHTSNGPAVGIFGDLAIAVYETSNPAFAPENFHSVPMQGQFFAYIESGDGGDTWSAPDRLIANVVDLPPAVVYALQDTVEPTRREVKLSGCSAKLGSLQALVWESPMSVDKRIFALTSFTAARQGEAYKLGSVGVLTWKPAKTGGAWQHVLTNRDIFLSPQTDQPVRTGSQYKYCALPGTAVRVIAYVNRSNDRNRTPDMIVLLVSTNMGDSFDYESEFSAVSLDFRSSAELVITNSACTHVDEHGDLWQDLLVGDSNDPERLLHALLPVGINVQGMDQTVSW